MKKRVAAFILLITATCAFAAVEKGPYMIWNGDNTTMTVLWQFDLDGPTTSSIKWGTTTEYEDSAATNEYGDNHQHQYTITGLTPGTKYCYSVPDVGTGSFTAAPPDDAQSVNFFVYGDTRSNPGDHDSVCGGMINSYTSDPLKQTIAILTGDFVTDGRIEDNWSDEFFPRNRDSLLQFQSEIVMCGPRGNHEYNGVLFDKYFPQPWVSDFYYSFDYGPVHVVVIDNFISYDPGSPQHNWIMSDLAASNKTWKIVTFHEPGWSSGIHSNNIDVQDYLQPLCIQYGVDIVLCGHNHNYQRAVVDGVHHITSGGGGAPLYDPVPGADSVVTQLRTLHFCEISINGHTLNFTARRPDGTEIETFQVTHTPLSPTVTLTAPSEGEELTVGNPTTISASVDAAGGTVTKVSFYADYGSGDEFLGEATEEPWEVSWPPSNTGVNVVVICTAYVAVGVSTETPSDTVTVTIVDPENPPPVADAGEDQTVTDTDGDRFETVTLDGSGSFDEGGSIESWTWKEGGIIRGTEEAFPFSFELGLHTVILEVLDNGGKTATDTMTVNVLSVTNVEPIADAGPDLHVLDADGNDNETVTLDGSGSDDPDGTIVKYEWDINNDGSYELVGYTDEPTVEYVFPIGSYTVVLRVTDNTGATHTDQVQVEVLKVVETRVAVSADDAEEDTSDDGSMDLESSDLELIEDTQQGRVQLVGIRFAGCGIPADAVIGNAYIQFTCKDASDEAVGVKIHGEAIDDASTFADVANNISDRDTTAASVVWEIPEWANEESAGPDERTPDLSAILQEIVNRPGYTPASAIAFIVSGTSGTRNAHSRDKGLDVAPLLHVEYSGGDPIIYPTCTITAPTEGATFTSPATVTITADAADGDGSIANVAFYTGTMLLGEVAGHSSSDLYTIDWSDVGVGTYSLTAVATDNDGLTTTSDAVSITVDPPAGVTIVNRPIAASADDAEERSSGSSSGSMDLISSDLELIQDGSRDQEVGVRFTGCDIPQGAVIISAYIQFTCKEESSDATIVTINGEAVDDAQQFTSDDFNISTRPRTGASAAWEIPEWVAEGDAGPAERTPELSAIIQEIVNRSLYTSSGAFVFIFTGSGGGTHNAYSFDEDDPVAPAVLHVEYSLPTFPEITEQPIDQSVPEDSPVTFSVTATGGNLSYQWQRDGVDITDATEATYTIATTTMANNGVSFTCTVSNTAGTVMSDAAVLTVAMLAPVITVQPEYQTVFEGEAATFSISATGTDISYQWRRGGSTIAEATEDSYTTPSVTMTDDGAVFTCVVSNAAGSVESDAALLTVTELTAPVIETHPASVTVDEGSPATFTIDASGDLLTYQWRREDVDIDEATEDSYTIDAVAMDDDGAYFNCVVSNNAGSVTSDAAILTVTMLPPEITTQPVSQTVDEGATVTFTVAATGTDLSYQWRRGEGVIADAVEASYTIDAATMDDDGAEFTCVVSNDGGSVTSEPAVLTVNMLPPVIVTQPASQTVDEGMTATFTIEAIGSLLSYQWKRDGSAIDGATDPSYTTGEVTIDDNEAVFNCVVSNAVESVTSTDAVLTVTIAVAPVITEHPLSQTVDEGATATFTIVATGSFLNYQWQRNGTAIEGANEDTYSTDAVTMGDDGASFTCVVNNTAGSVTSNAAILTVTMLPPVIETQPTSQTVDEGSPATFTIVATGSSLSYQWQRGSDDIEGATESSYTLESAAMADNGATFLCIVGNASGSVTSDAATLTVTMLPPVIETQPASQTVDEGLPAIFTVVAAGTNIGYQWYRDGTAIDEATEASYTVDAATMDYNGAEFTCVVSNVGGSVTSDAAVLTVNMLPPEIATHPADQTVDEGSTAIFTVVATGTSLSYQWRRGGSDISGATAASYTTDATTMGDDGASFTCVVSNEGGSVTSDAAILTVNMLPPSIVTHPTDQTVDEGSAATFTVVATGTDIGYQWQREAEDIEGATAALYTIDATTMDDDDASFRCVVSNAAGSVVSDAAILTVNMLPPVITTHPASQSVVEGSTSTFTVVATGTALSYQWQRDGSDITGGANDASYTTPVTILSDNGATFRCVVSNEGGTVTSNEAVLTVTMLPPVIETHPVSQTVDEGATATFTVTATGDELAYQWQKNGFNPMWKDGIKIGNLPYQKIWEEISGMTESRKPENLGHLWCHSDKSIDTLLAISIDDASHKGEWYLSGINAADNEDITSGVVDGIGYIYLGDIGDNSSSRSTITIRRVTEPTITGGNGTIPPESIESIICEYPADNVPSRKDAECLMFDSRTNKLFIITKRINPPKVYSLQHQSSYSGIQTLSFEGNAWDGMVSAVPFNNMNGGYVTGGTISKDGTKILLRGYRNVYFFSRDTSAQTVIQALQATPVTVSAFVDGGRPSSHWDNEPHGEGICFDPNDVDFYTSSESGDTLITGCSADNYPLRKYYNIKVAAVEDTFRQGYASYAGCEDTYIHSDEVSDVHDEDVFIVDKNYNSAGTSITNERLGLLKFDLSALPPDAVVIGADLRLNISQEGQDFAVHACYVPWDEASTWNSVNDGNGIPFDDVAASSFRVSVHGAPYSTANNHGYNNITGTVTCKSDSMVMLIQDWINGTIANNGFVIENIHSLAESKGDGFQFGSSEAATESLRPILIVRYYLPTSEPPYSDVPGATEATYTTPPAVFEDSGSLYRCVVSNPGGAVPSNGATLAVNMLPPVIVTHPASQTVDERSSAAFTIAATGVSLRYQWQRNGSDIPGATGAAYTTAATTMDDDGVIFRCVVRNTAGTVPSGEAELTVNRLPPEIKVQPVDRTVTEGETATFSIDILGSDVSYQWRRGDSDIAGATGSSYTTDELTISDDGAIFTCVVTNSAGAVTSDPVTLTVTMLPPTITTQPALQKVDEGSTATFTIMAIGTDLGYQWQRGGSDISGATEPSYTTDPATMADDGAEFLCIVSNVGGTVTSEAAILTVTMLPPEITTQPYSRTIDEGAAVTFTVAATGTALNYQWRRDGSDIAGGTDASYTIDAATMTDNGAEFLCVVSNDGGSVTSGPAVLTVTMLPPVISTQPVSQTVDEGSAVTFTIAATGTDISYQWRRDGSDIAGGTDASYTIDAATMADDGAEFRCVVSNAAGTETSDAADLTVTMLPPVITTQPASQTVTEGATATFTVAASGTDLGYQWRRDGGDIPGATSASFTTAAATMVDAGAIFTCKVSNAAGSVTSNEAVLTVTMLPPEITTQPASQAVDESSTVTFAVVATGTSLGYQWRRDGGDITGATGASYTIDQVTMADDGATFRCVVSNVGGSNTTDAAVLTVNKLLEIVFAPGWNMISFNIHPLDSFIETVFASIEDLVLVKNNAGQVYWPEFDINTIGSITTGEGYKVYTLSADTIRTPGRVIEVASTPISLTAGWSMIAYLPQNEMSIETALNGLESEITLVKDNEGNVYWPEYSINTIGMMKPGQGYKIHMKSAVTLIFP